MNCREALEFLAAYVADELEAGVRATFEKHLAVCPDCVHYLANYRATISAVSQSCRNPHMPADHELPEDLVRAILNARIGGSSQDE
ncbi:MAG: zf-HC2 domain-containing protein [Planctomycetota bacterium]